MHVCLFDWLSESIALTIITFFLNHRPSFRDNEVVWENVRVLKNSGETVSVDGTHLG